MVSRTGTAIEINAITQTSCYDFLYLGAIFEGASLHRVEDGFHNLCNDVPLEVGELLYLVLEDGLAHVRVIRILLVLQLQEERSLRPVAQHLNAYKTFNFSSEL